MYRQQNLGSQKKKKIIFSSLNFFRPRIASIPEQDVKRVQTPEHKELPLFVSFSYFLSAYLDNYFYCCTEASLIIGYTQCSIFNNPV
jgi:hypothetical protein